MSFCVEMHTDAGTRKETNQDSLCIKEAKTGTGDLLLAIVCDGMGGLQKGEVASSTIISAFSNWFEHTLPCRLTADNVPREVTFSWEKLIKEQNQNIVEYGKKNHIQLGSTITAMLFLPDGSYLIGHVGDSRAYRITDVKITLLTEDQTLVAREVKMGRLTPERAETDPRRNVLMQCIGASKIVEPAFYSGEFKAGECYMLCSDGFRHLVSPEEIRQAFSPSNNGGEREIKENIVRLTELNKERGETDNISAILIKIME